VSSVGSSPMSCAKNTNPKTSMVAGFLLGISMGLRFYINLHFTTYFTIKCQISITKSIVIMDEIMEIMDLVIHKLSTSDKKCEKSTLKSPLWEIY